MSQSLRTDARMPLHKCSLIAPYKGACEREHEHLRICAALVRPFVRALVRDYADTRAQRSA